MSNKNQDKENDDFMEEEPIEEGFEEAYIDHEYVEEEDIEEEYIEEEYIEDYKSRKIIRIVAAITVLCVLFLIATPLFTNLNLPSLDFLKESSELTQEAHVKKLQESITTITVGNRKGTGFNIDENGLIVTNAHVVKDAKNVWVSFYKGKEFKGEVWKLYPHIDLALIKIEGKALPKLELAQNTEVKHGDEVLIIGNPLDYTGVANKGLIYGMSKVMGIDEPILLIDGPVNKGNSGSPVINKKGEVIGVIFATINSDKTEEKKLGAAIPIYGDGDLLYIGSGELLL